MSVWGLTGAVGVGALDVDLGLGGALLAEALAAEPAGVPRATHQPADRCAAALAAARVRDEDRRDAVLLVLGLVGDVGGAQPAHLLTQLRELQQLGLLVLAQHAVQDSLQLFPDLKGYLNG